MPPRAAQKPKAPAEAKPDPRTPKSAGKRKADHEPSPTPKKRAKKEPATVISLKRDGRAVIPVNVTFEGESARSTMLKGGNQGITVKLEDSNTFDLVKTLVFTEGEFEGYQAIIIKPAKAFRFMDLPEEVRKRVYEIYFAPNGVVGKDIILEGRRLDKDVYAKSYSDGSKNRVGLLAVNKAIHTEAISLLYEHALKFESTTTVVDFMCQCAQATKDLLKTVEIKSFVKTSSRNAMTCLSNAVNITRLHIDVGVCSEGDPTKAAKAFWSDASKFLEAVSGRIGEKGAGVDVLSFGRQALTYKEGKSTTAEPWSESMRGEFLACLRAKMK